MMNYYDTFIRVAPDCPVSEAVVPSVATRRTSSVFPSSSLRDTGLPTMATPTNLGSLD